MKIKSFRNRFLTVLISFFVAVNVCLPPFSIKVVNSAELGMVGALEGSITLWEIFQTIFAGAGMIVANDAIQSSALLNLGSSSYTLEEMEAMGFIRVPEGGSSALDPEDWDWSGLENDLASKTSADAKIIQGVFSQSGGQGSGGDPEDPDNDPWYKKAVRWVKSAVANGKIEYTNAIANGNESIIMSLTSLAGMIGAFCNPFVEEQKPLNYSSSQLGYGLSYYSSVNTGITSGYFTYNNSAYKDYFFGPVIYSDGDSAQARVICRNKLGNSSYVLFTEHYTSSNGNKTRNQINVANGGVKGNIYAGSTVGTVHYAPYYTFDVPVFPDASSADSYLNSLLTDYENDGIRIKSPDVYTPDGNAGYTISNNIPDGAWVPTPYIEPGTHLEIIPQPQIDEFTQYINENNPELEPSGQAWVDTVSPYVFENLPEPTPIPTPRPQPTTVPNISPIPAGEPGTNENPIVFTEPDPLPEITEGFGTTYGLEDYFPFSIPFDLGRAYKIFEVEDDARQAPYIDYNLKIDRFAIDEHIILDFSMYDSSAEYLRVLVFISFCIGLMFATKLLIWG